VERVGRERLHRLAAAAAAMAAVVLSAAWLAGCSGLSPQDDDDPVGTACVESVEIRSPFNGGVGPVGTDTGLELATWNLAFFPQAGPYDFECGHPDSPARIQRTAELVNQLNLDVIALQEISSTQGFADLLALCPGYGGVLVSNTHGCVYQRPGLMYRKDIVTLNSQRTLTELSIFTREPLEADLTVTQSGKSYRFRLIVVHLKAGGDGSDVTRRQDETNALHAYLEARAVSEPAVNYVVAGDWNDVLTDPMSTTSFPAFVGDPDEYNFVVDAMKSRSDMASYGSGSFARLIDLIMVNGAACPDFAGAKISTLRLDALTGDYGLVSDHRPVYVSAPVFQ
jgi:endonuclease/exonuclease/phosphatase family metal-dependent hydrolase